MKAIVLAAGKGKRLNSEKAHLPKVMREAAGRTLLSYVLENISFIPHEDTVIVVGYMADTVKAAFPGDYKFVMQTEQLGTGHATSMAKDELAGYTGDVLVCFGDMPLFKQETFKELFRKHAADGNAVTLLTAMTEVPPAYGRIIRDENGNMVDIVEQKDCTPEQAKIREVTPGVYVFKSEWLFKALAQAEEQQRSGRVLPDRYPQDHQEHGRQGRHLRYQRRRSDSGREHPGRAGERRKGAAQASGRGQVI